MEIGVRLQLFCRTAGATRRVIRHGRAESWFVRADCETRRRLPGPIDADHQVANLLQAGLNLHTGSPWATVGDVVQQNKPQPNGLFCSRAAVGRAGIWHRRVWHCASAAIVSRGVEVQISFTAIGFIWKTHFRTVPVLATPANAFGIDEASACPAAT